MRIKVYGSRGSVPIANSASVAFGGNTTCIRVISDRIPPGTALVLDAGTGFVPLSQDLLREGGLREVVVLLTHYHHDHTQGLFLSPLTFMKDVKLRLCGPIQLGVDPKRMMQDLMRPPYFPVHYKRVESHVSTKGFEFPETLVLLFHPQGGHKLLTVVEYERLLGEGRFLPIGKGKYPVDECLVVTMLMSNHPEETISYRIEERPDRRVFVLLTDHEDQPALPLDLARHLQGASLIIMDAQYRQATYVERTAGYGHGTPGYCVRVAEQVGAGKLGLTHHDPASTDDDVRAIVEEAKAGVTRGDLEVFPCADYQEIEV